MLSVENSALKFIDLVPERFFQHLITHKYKSFNCANKNNLQQRITCILLLRQRLLEGVSIDHHVFTPWLDIDVAEKIIQQLNQKTILKNTYDNESYTDDIITNILNWLDNFDKSLIEEVVNTRNPQIKNSLQQSIDSQYSKSIQDAVSDKIKNKLDTKESFQNEVNIAADDINHSMELLNKNFKLERHIGWDLSKGIEATIDKILLIQTHQAIKNSKQIKTIIKMIGRKQFANSTLQEFKGINQQILNNNKNELPDSQSIRSVTGVCYGNDISRILPLELAQIANKKLKYLWYSRFAERQLLSYHFKGVMSEHVPDIAPLSIDIEHHGEERFKHSGPMILCVDTSASMKGRPEYLAKAIALEAMRIAHIEKRNCYLFCFSGPDEITQFEFSVKHGWTTIIDFLRLSFHGGTDINAVIQQALELNKHYKWQSADVLLLSDGRFSINQNIIDNIKINRVNMFVYGIQLGQWNLKAFNQLCDRVFDLSNA